MRENWQQEKESALLYRWMALQDPAHKKEFRELARFEEKHAKVWESRLKGITLTFKPRVRVLFLRVLGKVHMAALLEILERDERLTAKKYMRQEHWIHDKKLLKDMRTMLPQEKEHSIALAEIAGHDNARTGERWHRGGSSIRDIIFGMNDGLLSTFSLITGVSGAAVSNAMVLLSGLAGAVAGAISMAVGAYVSVKAEVETAQKQLMLEKEEIEHMPAIEERELVLMYTLKGISEKKATQLAKKIMSDKEVALKTMAKEELGINPDRLGSPLRAGIFSGISFIIGSSVPILPFVFTTGQDAIFTSTVISLSGFFLIGAGRTVITGKNPWRSGLEMFIIGTLAAIITYFIGSLIGGLP